MPTLRDARALFVSPHLDDVVLSCGGIVARMVEAGTPAMMITCFAGTPDPDEPLAELAGELHRMWGADSGETLVARRRSEDAAAARVLGVEPMWLDHREAIYRGGYPRLVDLLSPPVKADAAITKHLHAELMALWSQTDRADIYLPLAVGGHVDHRICFGAASGLRAAGATVWCYEDFPYVTKPRALDGRLALIRTPLQPEIVDVTRWLDRRVAASACYESQLEMIFGTASPHELVHQYATSIGGERIWKWT